MKIARRVLAVVLFCSTSLSQPVIDFDGYVVNVPAHLRLNGVLASWKNIGRNCWIDVTRVRLRPTLNLSESGYVALEYEADATYQSGISLLPVPSSVHRRQLVDLTWAIEKNDRWQIVHGFDRLYYRQQVGAFDISLGRQRVAWGSGRLWNPTDLFNPLNPTTFSKIEKDGVDAAMVKLTLGTFSDVTGVYNPQRDHASNYAVRIRTNIREFDMAGVAGYFDQQVVLGCDITGNLFDAGVRSEMIFSMEKVEPSRHFVKAVLGADYQWTAELYSLIEYHHNGEGGRDPTSYDLSRLSSGEMLNVGVDYLAVSASYLVHPLVTATVTCTGNVGDGSAFGALAVVYIPADEISVTLGGQLFTGSQLEEYWYYPNSCYAKVELFF